MKRTKRFLTMTLACLMMMGAVVLFAPAPETAANTFCHAGAPEKYIGLADNITHTHIINGGKVTFQCKIYSCFACGILSVVCPYCGCKV